MDLNRRNFLKGTAAGAAGLPEVQRRKMENHWRYIGIVGMTFDRYEAMLADQSGVCAMCGTPPKPEQQLAVDHDHATGEPRGLLCTLCNWFVGAVENSPERLRLATEYLEAA